MQTLGSAALIPRPFWNDGGPLLIAPQAAIAACDVDPESAAAPDVGPSWGVVIGTAAAQSALWLSGRAPREFFAVVIEACRRTPKFGSAQLLMIG